MLQIGGGEADLLLGTVASLPLTGGCRLSSPGREGVIDEGLGWEDQVDKQDGWRDSRQSRRHDGYQYALGEDIRMRKSTNKDYKADKMQQVHTIGD